MQKNQIFIILLMLAVLAGLSYYFGHWSTNKEEPESSVPSKSETEANLEKSEHNPPAKKSAPEASPKSLERTETSGAAASNGSAVKSQARLVQSGQSHILRLIDGSEMQPGYYRDFLVLNTNQVGRNLRTIPIELRVY